MTAVHGVPPAAAVARDVRITGAGGDGGEFVGIGRTEEPGAVAAHRMAGQVDACGVGGEDALCLFQHLQGVDAAPLFPVETVGPAVGRSDDIDPVLLFIGAGLVAGFDGSAVHGQDECLGTRVRRFRPQGRGHAVILHAAVDAAHESALVVYVRGYLPQGDGHGVDDFTVPEQFQPGRYVAFQFGAAGAGNPEFDFPNGHRQDIVGLVFHAFRGPVAVRQDEGRADAQSFEGFLGSVHHADRGPFRIVLPGDQVGQGQVAFGEHHRFVGFDQFRFHASEPTGSVDDFVQSRFQPHGDQGITEVVMIAFMGFAVDVGARSAGGLQQGDFGTGRFVGGVEVGRTHVRTAECAGGVGCDRAPCPVGQCRVTVAEPVFLPGFAPGRGLSFPVRLIGHGSFFLFRVGVCEAVACCGGLETVGGIEPGDHVLAVVEGTGADAAGQEQSFAETVENLSFVGGFHFLLSEDGDDIAVAFGGLPGVQGLPADGECGA